MKCTLTVILLLVGVSSALATNEAQDPSIQFLKELISELEKEDFFEPMPSDAEKLVLSFHEWSKQVLAAIEEEMGLDSI